MALTLAHEMADAVDADDQDRAELSSVALAVGQWLADQGRPGRWDTVDPAAVLEAMGLPDEVQRGQFLLGLVGLLGYAGISGHLPPGAAHARVSQIASLANDAIVRRFARHTASQLHGMLD